MDWGGARELQKAPLEEPETLVSLQEPGDGRAEGERLQQGHAQADRGVGSSGVGGEGQNGGSTMTGGSTTPESKKQKLLSIPDANSVAAQNELQWNGS